MPAGQVTAVALTDAGGHAYPAVQGPLHAADGRPAVDPYTPAGQSVHDPAPANEYRPAGQMDAVELTDPATHAYPALHAPSQLDDWYPVPDPNRPGVHGPTQVLDV